MALLLLYFDLAIPKLQSTSKDQRGELSCFLSEALLGHSLLLSWVFICLEINTVKFGFSHQFTITSSAELYATGFPN